MNSFVETMFNLLEQREFLLVITLFRDFLFIVIGILALLVVLHMLYYLGQKTPLYRRKPPVNNWSKQFFPAVFALVIALLLVIWGINWLIER